MAGRRAALARGQGAGRPRRPRHPDRRPAPARDRTEGEVPRGQEAARALLEEAAGRAGVPPERLAERVVPRYGLDGDGSLAVDYGPRRFRAGFDERLEPFVADGSGRRLKALPGPARATTPHSRRRRAAASPR
ncbi:hypothetical protein [Actinomadura sp. CNU-125]|uniref:hypothetical protein n=1 Tax=Actinomadura sp. CNU-125 TaxID=1904961 RepID=UPI001177E310|nr:hypothetical protein [Actinomadura sp. CNU-125]